jgi:hypothetical protein
MKFMLLIYNDNTILDALPAGQADTMMRECLGHADELRQGGHLIDSQMLEDTDTAKSVRIRQGRPRVTDGPFSEAKEVLGGYWMIQVKSREEAIQWASRCPASDNEVIEIRQVQELGDFPSDLQQIAQQYPQLQQRPS